MKIEEAIKQIEKRIDIAEKNHAEEVEYIRALKLAVEALKGNEADKAGEKIFGYFRED